MEWNGGIEIDMGEESDGEGEKKRLRLSFEGDESEVVDEKKESKKRRGKKKGRKEKEKGKEKRKRKKKEKRDKDNEEHDEDQKEKKMKKRRSKRKREKKDKERKRETKKIDGDEEETDDEDISSFLDTWSFDEEINERPAFSIDIRARPPAFHKRKPQEQHHRQLDDDGDRSPLSWLWDLSPYICFARNCPRNFPHHHQQHHHHHHQSHGHYQAPSEQHQQHQQHTHPVCTCECHCLRIILICTILCFLSGWVNAVGVVVGGVTVTHITANWTLIGLDVSGPNPAPNRPILEIVFFFGLGALITGFIMGKKFHRRYKYIFLLLLQSLFLTAGIITWRTVHNDWAFPLFSLASGLQNALVTSTLGLTTVGVTRFWTDIPMVIGSSLHHRLLTKSRCPKERRLFAYIPFVTAFCFGGSAGGAMARSIDVLAIIPPAISVFLAALSLLVYHLSERSSLILGE